jgi:hypothetical protein
MRWNSPRAFARPERIALAAAALCALAAGCDRGSGEAPPKGQALPQHRTFAVQRWDTLWSVGGPGDSTLLNPYLLSAAEGAVYVYDGAARRVVALSPADGHVLWRYGRQGAGPDEFRGVRDLKRAEDGGVFVLDPRNNRLTELDPRGAVEARIPLEAVGHAEQVAPLPGGQVVLLTMLPDSAFAVVDRSGKVMRHFTVPWPGFARLDPLARQGFIAAQHGHWVYGFSMGDGWFPFNGASPAGFTGRYVEHTDFPRVETHSQGDQTVTQMAEYNACSACSISIWGSTLYVHFGGYGDAPKRTVDRYDLASGRYLGSDRLPIEATAVEGAGDRVYVLAENPYPILLALKPHT